MNWLVSIARDKMMKMTFKVFIVFLLFCGHSAAQDAALLPNAMQTFVNQNGQPYNGGKVYFYIPGTGTLKDTWIDGDKNVLNSNPVILDSAGRAVIYGDGIYRQVLRDRNNNLIWDKITASTGTGGGGSGGDGESVGIIKGFAGITPPTNYLFTYGQEISRVTYVDLFTAITIDQTATCSITSPTLTAIGDTTQIPIGSAIEASCLAAGATVISKTANSVTASSNATITTSLTAKFLPWGGGNGTTTFNLPDLRGRLIAGRDNMGGIAASRLTTAYFANASAIGAVGGSQSAALVEANLAAHTHTGTTSTNGAHTHGLSENGRDTGGSTAPTVTGAGTDDQTGSAGLHNHTFTTNSTGSGTAFSIVQPTLTANYIIKVLPDAGGGGGGGSGTVNAGTAGQLAYYGSTGTAVTGNANITISSGAVTLGVAGSVVGSTAYSNATSGTIKLEPTTGALGSSVLTLPAATGTVTYTVASGAKALATGAISSTTCTSAQTDTATGVASTDTIQVTFNADPTSTTGYIPLVTGMLSIFPYPTTDTVNFKVCNNTGSSITPGAITLNWRVVR